MKRVLIIITLLFSVLALASCSDPSPKPKPEKPIEPLIRGDSAVVFGANDAFTLVYGSGGDMIAADILYAVEGLGLKKPVLSTDTDKTESKCERSYLYNGYDILFDAKLYMTQDVRFADQCYSAMLPISKQYGNCAMFYCEDGSTVYMKTPLSGSVDEFRMGVNATVIDMWGEKNPYLHMTVTLNNPEDQLRDHLENSTTRGYVGLRDMLGRGTNKLYCSLFSKGATMKWGESLHFNTKWSFSVDAEFKNPSREPDFWVGVPK